MPKLIRKKAALAFITKNMFCSIASLKPVPQLSFASSKSTIETLKKVVKYFQEKHQNDVITNIARSGNVS